MFRILRNEKGVGIGIGEGLTMAAAATTITTTPIIETAIIGIWNSVMAHYVLALHLPPYFLLFLHVIS